ncbi:MAG: ABC transporter ATP-binding protein [Mycobacteriales bacterium]
MSPPPVITVAHLMKEYGGGTRAVDDISFTVQRGEVFALLGPNGAGKTTTVEILTGHRRRTAGTVDVLGCDPWHDGRALRQLIGVVLQTAGIDADLTLTETVRLYAGFYRRPKPTDEVLDLVSLSGKRAERVRNLSGGQLRRLDLALALVGDPQLLFLDEPTTGLDPLSRREAWDLVAQLRDQGTTVLLTSHYMDEVQHLADRVAVIGHGRVVEESTPSTLAGRNLAEVRISFLAPYPGWVAELPSGPYEVESQGGEDVVLRSSEPTAALALVTGWAVGRGEELIGLTVTRPSLEEAYLSLTEQGRPQP